MDERTKAIDSAVRNFASPWQTATAAYDAGVAAERERWAPLVDRLKMAVRQNEHDMLMTGDELRACRAALDALGPNVF